ncbi:MAG: glycosyltransferase [Planctomycetota bacterium]
MTALRPNDVDDQPAGVTVYVPCYDVARFLPEVLPALFAQTQPIAELLVVDDGSRDDTAAVAERLLRDAPFPARIVRHDGNKGLGAARNTAVRAARTALVASIDADVVVEPNWLAELVAELEDPEVAGVGGNLLERNRERIADRWRDHHMRQSWGDERIVEPRFLYGSNNVFRRAALVEAGLYDERCRTNGEDYAVSVAVRANGGRMVYTPAARCHHLRTDTVASIVRTYWRWNYFGNWKEVTFRRTFSSLSRNFRHVWRTFLAKDLRRGDLRDASIDVALAFASGWYDLREHFRRRRAERERQREQEAERARIEAVCKGWSNERQWRAFERILDGNPNIERICVLGVYLGRDIAYIQTLLRKRGRSARIVGVDRFADVPGEDWPEDKRHLSWDEAGFGTPPALEHAGENLDRLGLREGVELRQGEMADFLAEAEEDFDWIYVDVAHDYETTLRAIELARPRLRPGGILGGDDYSDEGTWGVARAVRERCPDHEVLEDWIWVARPTANETRPVSTK